jgi:hypothetical protein
VGRTLADGTDEESAYAARMDTWIAWETEEVAEVERLTPGVGISRVLGDDASMTKHYVLFIDESAAVLLLIRYLQYNLLRLAELF